MTYFVAGDDNRAYDAEMAREIDARREMMIKSVNRGQPTYCRLPEVHDPRHPADMKFHVGIDDDAGRAVDGWEDLTEDEIIERHADGKYGVQFGSQFDFWWD